MEATVKNAKAGRALCERCLFLRLPDEPKEWMVRPRLCLKRPDIDRETVEDHSNANRMVLMGKLTDSVQSCRAAELSRSIT